MEYILQSSDAVILGNHWIPLDLYYSCVGSIRYNLFTFLASCDHDTTVVTLRFLKTVDPDVPSTGYQSPSLTVSSVIVYWTSVLTSLHVGPVKPCPETPIPLGVSGVKPGSGIPGIKPAGHLELGPYITYSGASPKGSLLLKGALDSKLYPFPAFIGSNQSPGLSLCMNRPSAGE